MRNKKLYICMFSVHGLIRGQELELGRDADTGGQTIYVLDLAKALARHPDVEKVDLFTRKIQDATISQDYGEMLEPLENGLSIVRIPCGPEGYLPKEALWDHIDSFVDNSLEFFKEQDRFPDAIHSHYADAGYVGSRISHVLGIPLAHTGHSLGRVKRQRLLASGLNRDEIEQRYNMSRRIEAEELTLMSADCIFVSTNQEIEEQYALYDFGQNDRMVVNPPGIDLSRFHPPQGNEWRTEIAQEIIRFLKDHEKPIILAIARPDARKNLASLVKAYGESSVLQERANLVLVAGIRNDITDLEEGAQEVLRDILFLIDRLNLYGKVAYPKSHRPEDVPILYRLAASSGGVFVNPALTEPFGLTLIEAGASGLPIVATSDGGPRDITANCRNGLLVNPLESSDIARGLEEILLDWEHWHVLSTNGMKGVRSHYTWPAHIEKYMAEIYKIVAKPKIQAPKPVLESKPARYIDRALFSDLDQNLLSNRNSLLRFVAIMTKNKKTAAFGIATGRRLDSALKVMRKNGIPVPDVLITSCGTEIHYAPNLTEDRAWTHQLEKNWTPSVVKRVMRGIPGVTPQDKSNQSRFKLSYFYAARTAPPLSEIKQKLLQEEAAVNAILSYGQYLDILPIRATKGLALRYVANAWGVPLERMLTAGGSGADEDMMRGNTLAVVVGNRHHEELSQLIDVDRIYFAKENGAAGILEAIQFYDFFGKCSAPKDGQL